MGGSVRSGQVKNRHQTGEHMSREWPGAQKSLLCIRRPHPFPRTVARVLLAEQASEKLGWEDSKGSPSTKRVSAKATWTLFARHGHGASASSGACPWRPFASTRKPDIGVSSFARSGRLSGGLSARGECQENHRGPAAA